MGGCEEQYCLRWHDFQANVTSAFSDIRDDEDLLDVTLACPDGRMLRAHKLMLSACSPMFKAMLQRNSHPQPVIFLHGVSHHDISAILNFMYHGEVNVTEGNIGTFLAVAEDLKVRGLTQADLQDRMPPALKRSVSVAGAAPSSPKRSRIEEEDEVEEVEGGAASLETARKEPANVKLEPSPNPVTVTPDISGVSVVGRKHVVICESRETARKPNRNDRRVVRHNSIMIDYSNEEGVSYHRLGGRDADDPMSTMTVALSHKGWHCPECLHTSTTKGNLKSHILSGRHKLFEKSHSCQFCHRNYSTRQSLQVHVSTHHRFERDAEYHKESAAASAAATAKTEAVESLTATSPSVSTLSPQHVAQIVQAACPAKHQDGGTAVAAANPHHHFVNYLSQQATMVGSAFAATTAAATTTGAPVVPLNYQVSATNDMRLQHNV